MQLDSKAPSIDLAEYIYNETRYKTLQQSQPEVAAKLLELAKKDVRQRWNLIEKLANLTCECEPKQNANVTDRGGSKPALFYYAYIFHLYFHVLFCYPAFS